MVFLARGSGCHVLSVTDLPGTFHSFLDVAPVAVEEQVLDDKDIGPEVLKLLEPEIVVG